MQNCLGSYSELISSFLKKGYETACFSTPLRAKKQLILRHDIDFDCGFACSISQVENDLGVKATYFFLLSSDSYNLLSKENADFVKEIKAAGHQISLHFDPTLYGDDFAAGFRYERGIFEKTFDVELKIISIHRPNPFFLSYDETIDGVEHTYQKKFSKDIKYVSDSQGAFRFGHPFDSEEFKAGKTIQLLTHPIWWQCGGETNIGVLKNFIAKRQASFNAHVGRNCIPYQNYLDKK